MIEDRSGLERELIVRDVRGLKLDCATKILKRFLDGLLRQAVHQIQIEIVEPGTPQFVHRSMNILSAMDASKRFQLLLVEGLHAERHASHAGFAIPREATMLDGSRVRLERHFQLVTDDESRSHRFQEQTDLLGTEQARRAAAEENRDERSIAHLRQIVVEILDQRLDVLALRHVLRHRMRVEIAVGTLAHAPGQMHVQRQRRRFEKHFRYVGAIEVSRKRETSIRSALPR